MAFLPEHDRARAVVARVRPGRADDAAAARIERVVDRQRHGAEHARHLAFRRYRGEALRVFLVDEAGREPAFPPARRGHDGGEEAEVVADALDDEAIERVGLGRDGGGTVRPEGDQLGDHRIVVHRDLAALRHAGIDAGDALALAPGRRRLEDGEPPGRGGQSRAPGPRRRSASRPPSPGA